MPRGRKNTLLQSFGQKVKQAGVHKFAAKVADKAVQKGLHHLENKADQYLSGGGGGESS